MSWVALERAVKMALWHAVHVDGARAALADAAAVFCAGQIERVAQDPEQWSVGGCIERT
jgi:hypothetical protein